MMFLKKVKIFLLLSTKSKLLLFEALFYLGWARFLKSRPFSKVAPKLGKQFGETSLEINDFNKKILRDISHAVNIMSRNTIWESMCLVKGIAALKMLERRGIESTLYLGTAKGDDGGMLAHAWLRSGPYFITGEEEKEGFVIVCKFAKIL